MAKVTLSLWDHEHEIPRREIVEGLLAEGELCFLTGQPKSGKSAVALALVGAVATGSNFLGRLVVQGDAVYFALERRHSVRRRITALGLPQGARLWLVGGALSLVNDVDAVIEGIEASASDVRLIVIDTLARAATGMDENSSKDMGLAARALAEIGLAFPSAAIVVIHHTSKAGDSARGSNALIGAADIEMRADARGGRRFLEVVNANEIAEGQKIDFVLEPVEVSDGETAIRAIASPSAQVIRETNKKRSMEAEHRALAALDHLPAGRFGIADAIDPLTAAGIVEGLERRNRRTKTERILHKAVAKGWVIEVDGQLCVKGGGGA